MAWKIENNTIFWENYLPMTDKDWQDIYQDININKVNSVAFCHPEYNHPLDNIPEFIEHINIMHSQSPKYCNLFSKFNQPINHLPSNIISINLNLLDYSHNLDNLPINLTELKINIPHIHKNLLDNLPSKLKYLEINTKVCNLSLNNLPNSLKKLIISCTKIDTSLKNLPQNLESIIIKSENNIISHQFEIFNDLYARHRRIRNLKIGCFNFFYN